jgi:hypothetical protein
MRQGDEIVYVERAYSERSGMQVVRAIGGRAPLHLTSTGKLFLAADDPQRIRAYATRTGLHGQTRNSITQLPALERELAKVRQYGICADNEELELGVRCMACRHLRRPGQAGGRPVDLGAGRAGWTKTGCPSCRPRRGRSPTTLGLRAGSTRLRPLRWRITMTIAQPSGLGRGRGIGLDPAAHALGVAQAAQLAGRIQEHHDQLAPGHRGLHHQARPASEM